MKSLHIVTVKTDTIILAVDTKNECLYYGYDGPGEKCSKLKAFVTKTDKQTDRTSSFQCFVLLYHIADRTALCHSKLSYRSEPIPYTKSLSVVKPVNLQYPSLMLLRKPVVVVEVNAKSNVTIKTTINEMQHDFGENLLCLYGGISIYSIIGERNEEVFTLCKPVNGKL